MEFKLSGRTLEDISKSTGLSKDDLFNLSLHEASKLMKNRGALIEQNKLKQWFSDFYKKIGEKLGFLQKEYMVYSDCD